MSAELVTGRELDAQIATQVMGWHFDGRVWSDADGLNQEYVDGWSPSTSIEAAWQVVEHFVAQGAYVQVEGLANGLVHDGWQCTITPHRDVTLEVEAWSDTAALAICRAALVAVGKS